MMCRTGLATLVFTLIGIPIYSRAQQTPQVVVDTDAGTDDLMAISYLLAGAEVSLKAITVVNGLAHAEQGARNILRLLELAGRTEIPVFVGETHPLAGNAAFPEEWRRLSDNLPDVTLPQSGRSPEKQSAVEYLAKEMRLAGGGPSLRILALGPLTNIARALEAYPSRVRGIRSIVIMGGAISVPGNLGDGGVFKTENKTAEWNMYIDPLAANRVLASGLPIELVPLDATNHVPINAVFVRDFSKKTSSPLGLFVSQLFAGERDLIEQHAFYAWDPLAAVILAHPGIARFKNYHIEIEMKAPAEGQTRSLAAGKPNTRVASDVEPAAFMRLFTSAFLQRSPQTR